MALALLPDLAAAQPASGQPPRDAGPIDRFGRLAAQQVELSGGTEDGTASISLQIANWRGGVTRVGNAQAARRINDTLDFILSTPLNGGEEAAPATLDGLTSGTRLALRWGRWVASTPLVNPPAANAIYEQAQAACRATEATAHTNRLRELGSTPSPAAVEAVTAIHAAALAECEDPSGGSQNLVQEHLPHLSRRYIAAFIPTDARQFGFEAAISTDNFEFVDPVTLAEGSQRHVSWSASGFFTQYLRHSSTAVTVSASYQRAYKAADEEVFCPAGVGPGAVRCTTARGAPPGLDENFLLSIGTRHRFMRNGSLLNLAVAPQLTYEVIDDVFGVDVPVYFIPNTDAGLTGGIRFGYRSDREDEFSVGIFIGAAFDVLN